MAVRHFHHLALAVPDVPVQKTFYEDFGLMGEEIENRAVLRCAGRAQDQIVLVEAPERKLHHVSYGASEEGLAAVTANVEASELATRVDGPVETPYEGIWFTDFEGNLYNVHVSEHRRSAASHQPSRESRSASTGPATTIASTIKVASPTTPRSFRAGSVTWCSSRPA